MSSKKPSPDNKKSHDIIAEARRRHEEQEQTYREKALKMFPSICARCGREFSGKKLRELTVHHKNHDHDYNPSDGSNWELLCLYCHDNEHQRYLLEAEYGDRMQHTEQNPPTTYKPFAGLETLLKRKK